jgi:uncharacterized phiE125 gp8 family phage protein
MRYKQTVAPTLTPITLDEAKAQCAVSGMDDHDAYIASLIERATDVIGKRIGRQVMSATWTLTLDGFSDEIVIDVIPVSGITSVAYTDVDGDSQTWTAAYYQTDLSTNDGCARIKPAYGYTWPLTRADVYGSVVVTFTAGYTTQAAVPLGLKHAVAFLVGHWFANREPVVMGTDVRKLPEGIEMLLALEEWGNYV